MKTRVLLILMMTSLVGGVLAVNGRADRTGTVALDTAQVRRKPLEEVVLASGRLRARSDLTLFAPRAGLVSALQKEGSEVVAGEAVAVLGPGLGLAVGGSFVQSVADLNVAVAQADLGVERAQRSLVAAEHDQRRSQQLYGYGLLSRERLERADLDAEMASLALRQSRRERERLRNNAVTATIAAPWNGVVLEVTAKEGKLVGPGEPLLTLARTGSLEVVLQVPEADSARVHLGQRARLRHPAWPGKTFTAEVRRIAPRALQRLTAQGEETVVEVIGAVLEPGGLKPGFNVEGEIVVRSTHQALFVPTEAVSEEGGWVAAVRGGRLYRRRVVVGSETAEGVEIVQGLAERMVVALSPPARLEDGTRLVSRRERDR